MKVTVVTPVYNGMPWLPECIDSVAEQRRDVEVEHLVYDGGSTDGSAEWLREHTSLGYEAIIGPDGGQTDALAKGFSRATGEIFAWLNADDVLEPGALKRVVDVFTADPNLAMVVGACLVIDSRGVVTGAIDQFRCRLSRACCAFHGIRHSRQRSSLLRPTGAEKVSIADTTLPWISTSG